MGLWLFFWFLCLKTGNKIYLTRKGSPMVMGSLTRSLPRRPAVDLEVLCSTPTCNALNFSIYVEWFQLPCLGGFLANQGKKKELSSKDFLRKEKQRNLFGIQIGFKKLHNEISNIFGFTRVFIKHQWIPAEPFNCGTSYTHYMSFKATIKEVSKIGEWDLGNNALKDSAVLINVGKRRTKTVWIDKAWSSICFKEKS